MSNLLIMFVSILFGISQKVADLFNEHGLKASPLSSIVVALCWSITGSLLIRANIYSAVVILATVFYWLIKLKLDSTNHTIAGTLLLLYAFYEFNNKIYYFNHVVLLFIWFTINGFVNTFLKNKYSNNSNVRAFLRLRLFIYVGPLIYSICVGSYIPFTTSLFGMIGTEFVTNYSNITSIILSLLKKQRFVNN